MNENLIIEIKKESVMFKNNGALCKIPSKLYPLNGRNLHIFDSLTTNEIYDEKIKDIFDACKFESNSNYRNADMIMFAANYVKEDKIKFYSGWFFNGTDMPTHRAWAVYDDKCVLDGGIMQTGRPVRKNTPNHERYCFGKVPEPFMFVGCEDTFKHAQDLFVKAVYTAGGKHPSYPGITVVRANKEG